MKRINLLMIDNIFSTNPQTLNEAKIIDYLELTDIKEQELKTLNRFCQMLKSCDSRHYIFDNYYIGYKIPQISKEFDLLRLGENFTINIELKSEKIDKERILNQLKQNYYFLSFLPQYTYCFTFVTDGNNDLLYYYDSKELGLKEITNIYSFGNLIETIQDREQINLDELFVPTNYLVSPFNSTTRFINGEYFLTNHQEDIKKTIIKKIVENSEDKIFSINGSAGTGKTLLTYDIAKELQNIGKQVNIIHCAQDNEGICTLRQNGWSINEIKYYENFLLSEVLIIDESQRLSKIQVEKIIQQSTGYLIFSHDIHQKLNRTNQSEIVVEYILNSTPASNNYKLSNKIRHNKPLASFVTKLFDLSKISTDQYKGSDYDDISFYFTKELSDAKYYVYYLKSIGWEYIYLTPSRINAEPLDKIKFLDKSSHKVIGQEYDNVVVIIDEHFYYTSALKLSYNASAFYNPLETLFQAITRTRKKLTLVIINNENVYKHCINIINR